MVCPCAANQSNIESTCPSVFFPIQLFHSFPHFSPGFTDHPLDLFSQPENVLTATMSRDRDPFFPYLFSFFLQKTAPPLAFPFLFRIVMAVVDWCCQSVNSCSHCHCWAIPFSLWEAGEKKIGAFAAANTRPIVCSDAGYLLWNPSKTVL